MKAYRFVTEDLRSEHGEVQWKIGEWQKQNGGLSLCENGFHASKEPIDSLDYIFGTRWFVCEGRGEILHDSDKFCAKEMRLIKEIPISVIKRFAVDCAKHVLPIFEKQYPEDKRPREAIEAAELYLAEPTPENLMKLKAAGDAARDAWAAAWDAGAAAWAAARAAWDAWGADRDAERKWQNKHLKKLITNALKEAPL